MICILCHFEIIEDDIEVRMSSGRCLCLGCFHRGSALKKPMPKALQRELTEALGAMNPEWFHLSSPPYRGGFRPYA